MRLGYRVDTVRRLDGVDGGGGDGLGVEIEAVHGDFGVGQGHSDAGPAEPAGDVGDPGAGGQSLVDGGNRRQPLLAQQVQESGAVGRLAALRLPRHRGGRAAGPEGVDDVTERPRGPHQLDAHAGAEQQARRVGEHRHVPGGQ